jgi:putative tryptophan/tyrosine transport system substrate-binding protein
MPIVKSRWAVHTAAKRKGLPMDRHVSCVSRRQFVLGAGATGLGLLAGCGRLPWQAAPPAKVYRAAFLSSSGTTSNSSLPEAFREGLRELGYVEGQNIAIEWRFAEGKPESLSGFAAELVELQPDVLVVTGSQAIRATEAATSTIPIVIAFTGDPLETGLVASLARPGGNVTGLSSLQQRLGVKRLELLKEASPGVSRVGVLWNAGNSARVAEWEETEAAAHALSVQVHSLEVRGPSDFDNAFQAAVRARVDALVTFHDSLTATHSAQVVEFAAINRLPAMYGTRAWTDRGGLMAYGANAPSMYRRAAVYVDKILRGTRPADLPIEQPMRFDFVVNMKTAQALGITFPNEIMLQVTEVVQ